MELLDKINLKMDKDNKLNEMTNSEILFYIKQLESNHEALKLKMIKDYDSMVEIEMLFDKANKLLVKRLKGE